MDLVALTGIERALRRVRQGQFGLSLVVSVPVVPRDWRKCPYGVLWWSPGGHPDPLLPRFRSRQNWLNRALTRWRINREGRRIVLCCGMVIASLNAVMIPRLLTVAGVVLALQLLGLPISTASPIAQTQAHRGLAKHRPSRTKKLAKEGGWAGAGLAAGRAAGPAGSAAVGAVKYRKDLKAGGKRRTKAVAKIGAPIAAGAVAGPAGSAGVEAVEHRKWIKRQMHRVKPHKFSGS